MSPREIISPQLELGTDRPIDRFDQPIDRFDRPTDLIDQIQRDEAALSRSKRPKSTRFDQKDDRFRRKNSRFDQKSDEFDLSGIQTTDPSAAIVNPFWFVMHFYVLLQGSQFLENDMVHIKLTVLNTIC